MADGRVDNGGAREGAGRKRRPAFKDDGGLMPLDLMLSVVRNEDIPMPSRLEQAKQCAPYCHARLQSRELTVDADVSIELISYLDADD